MNDPEVVSLTYRLVVPDWLHFHEDAMPWDGTLGEFRGRLTESDLVMRPLRRFPNADAARAALDPLLKGWEAAYELEHSRAIEFQFVHAEIVDRNPTPGALAAHGASLSIATHPPTVTVGSNYPTPPQPALVESPFAKELRLRWRATREGYRPTLLAQAYAILTEIEQRFGGSRASAAKTLRISAKILDRLGALTAQGAPHERRKATPSPQRPISSEDWLWINTAIRRIVKRVIEVENHVPDLPPLDMSDLK